MGGGANSLRAPGSISRYWGALSPKSEAGWL